MADTGQHNIPGVPIRALSKDEKDTLKEVIEYWSKKDNLVRDSAMLPVHTELHRMYWDNGKELPSTVGSIIDVGIPDFVCEGKIIAFREYLRISRIINAQFGVTKIGGRKAAGVLIAGSPGIGVCPAPC